MIRPVLMDAAQIDEEKTFLAGIDEIDEDF
jgi:hypothetical protein